MARRFNLDNYVGVDERIRRFYTQEPGGSIHTTLRQHDDTIVFHAAVYRHNEAQPWATGYAASPNKGEKALEKVETTAIGRALANAGFVKEDEQRPSREEMEDLEPGDPTVAWTNQVKTALLDAAGGDVAAAKAAWTAFGIDSVVSEERRDELLAGIRGGT